MSPEFVTVFAEFFTYIPTLGFSESEASPQCYISTIWYISIFSNNSNFTCWWCSCNISCICKSTCSFCKYSSNSSCCTCAVYQVDIYFIYRICSFKKYGSSISCSTSWIFIFKSFFLLLLLQKLLLCKFHTFILSFNSIIWSQIYSYIFSIYSCSVSSCNYIWWSCSWNSYYSTLSVSKTFTIFLMLFLFHCFLQSVDDYFL